MFVPSVVTYVTSVVPALRPVSFAEATPAALVFTLLIESTLSSVHIQLRFLFVAFEGRTRTLKVYSSPTVIFIVFEDESSEEEREETGMVSFTFTVQVAVYMLVPLVAVTVMVHSPSPTPVTTPLSLTEATPLLLLFQLYVTLSVGSAVLSAP